MLGDVKDEQPTYNATRAGALQRRLSQSYLTRFKHVPCADTARWEHVWKVSMCKIVFKLYNQDSRVRMAGRGVFTITEPICQTRCTPHAHSPFEPNFFLKVGTSTQASRMSVAGVLLNPEAGKTVPKKCAKSIFL